MSYLRALAVVTSWHAYFPVFSETLLAKIHRSILSSPFKTCEILTDPLLDLQSLQLSAFFTATLTPAASAAPLKQMQPGENKAGGRGG